MLGEKLFRDKLETYKNSFYSKIESYLDRLDEEMKKRIDVKRKPENDVTVVLKSDSPRKDMTKKRLKRKLEKSDTKEHMQKVRDQSMLDSQGTGTHSGSGYHGPGNVDHEKTNSNKAQRNFDNHQGN
jgi:uncharacterized protein YwbE